MLGRNSRAAEIMNAIREVLITDWDPIGVISDREWPRDEYDSYIGRIYSRLASGEPAEAIAKYLCIVEVEIMGLGEPPVSSRLVVAKRLKALNITV